MIYLDNAATTFPKPPSVGRSVLSAVTTYGGNPGRSGHAMSLKTSEKIYGVRSDLSRFFNVEPEQVIFTNNCSQALNMAIKGVMGSGGHAITSSYEHNSVIRPLYVLKQKQVIDYDIAPIVAHDVAATLENFKRLLRPTTKAIICTHASNVTGLILPIKELGDFCREHHLIFIVDGAQTAGVLPVNLPEMNIDIFCTAGHKGLYGITGTGLMVLGSDIQLDTLIEGGTGSVSDEIEQPSFLPDRFESGTLGTAGILSMGAGLAHIQKTGISNVYQHEFTLCEELYQQLNEIDGIATYVDFFQYGYYVPVVLFNVIGKKWWYVVTQMSDRGYALRGGVHCSFLAHQSIGTIKIGAVRLAPSIFTTQKEIHSFVGALKEFVRTDRRSR